MDGVDVIDILDGVGVGHVTTPYWNLLCLKRQGFIVVGICDYRAKSPIFSRFSSAIADYRAKSPIFSPF